MSWIAWICVIFGCLVGVDAVFVCALLTASWIRDRRELNEQRITG